MILWNWNKNRNGGSTLKTKRRNFDPFENLKIMESCRRPSGGFVASPPPDKDYNALWLRDFLYCIDSYWYMSENEVFPEEMKQDFKEKLFNGMCLAFDFFKRDIDKIIRRVGSPIDVPGGVIHARRDANTFKEITHDFGWGHDQLDMIGQFLYIVADFIFKNVEIVKSKEDLEILQLIVFYLRSVEYWHRHDFGMWEECKLIHFSSLSACVGGLGYLRRQNIRFKNRILIIDDSLLRYGEETLKKIFPYESRPEICMCDLCKRHARDHPKHSHDCDAAQMTSIWPYHVINERREQDLILSRLVDGHVAQDASFHKLLQKHGFNRYWGDDYRRSSEKYGWISAEWIMFKFWVSIIYSQRHELEISEYWFLEADKEIRDNKISEAFRDGEPNDHTPLAWAHAISQIAFAKLPLKTRLEFVTKI
jgi:hypothetical protein